MDDLLKESDFIFPAWAVSGETCKLLSEDKLKMLKKSAIVASFRGPKSTYNHDFVIKMVEEGKLFGYAFEGEEGEFGNYTGNVWAGPTLGWLTQETMRRNGDQWAQSIAKASFGNFETRVN